MIPAVAGTKPPDASVAPLMVGFFDHPKFAKDLADQVVRSGNVLFSKATTAAGCIGF